MGRIVILIIILFSVCVCVLRFSIWSWEETIDYRFWVYFECPSYSLSATQRHHGARGALSNTQPHFWALLKSSLETREKFQPQAPRPPTGPAEIGPLNQAIITHTYSSQPAAFTALCNISPPNINTFANTHTGTPWTPQTQPLALTPSYAHTYVAAYCWVWELQLCRNLNHFWQQDTHTLRDACFIRSYIMEDNSKQRPCVCLCAGLEMWSLILLHCQISVTAGSIQIHITLPLYHPSSNQNALYSPESWADLCISVCVSVCVSLSHSSSPLYGFGPADVSLHRFQC